LHHIIEIPLFAIFLVYSCCIVYFWHVDRRVESELPENFQDIDFEYLEQQQAGFEGMCP
jgi:hypothetical protein